MADSVAGRAARPTAIVGHPIYGMLLPVTVVCLVAALITDLSYLNSGGNLIWLAFSSWLLLAGLIFGALAAVMLLIDFVRVRGLRSGKGYAHMLLLYAALLVELLSMFVHQRDGWTAVAGLGLILSIIGAALVLAAAWLHRPAVELIR
jgi:uncharacterized membrane protein